MNSLAIFGVAAAATGLYTVQRYDGQVRYTGGDVDTPAGNLRHEDGAPDPSTHRSIYAAAVIAAGIGAAFLLAPRIAMATGGAERAFASDYAVFTKIGAGALGAGVGLGGGVGIAELTTRGNPA